MADWRCFDLFLISQSVDMDNSAHNDWFLIAQTQKIGILQVAISEGDEILVSDYDGKPSTLTSFMPSVCNHYFRTLLIPPKVISCPCALFLTTHILFLWSFSQSVSYLVFGAEISRIFSFIRICFLWIFTLSLYIKLDFTGTINAQ